MISASNWASEVQGIYAISSLLLTSFPLREIGLGFSWVHIFSNFEISVVCIRFDTTKILQAAQVSLVALSIVWGWEVLSIVSLQLERKCTYARYTFYFILLFLWFSMSNVTQTYVLMESRDTLNLLLSGTCVHQSQSIVTIRRYAQHQFPYDGNCLITTMPRLWPSTSSNSLKNWKKI